MAAVATRPGWCCTFPMGEGLCQQCQAAFEGETTGASLGAAAVLLLFAEEAVAAGQVKGSNDPVTLLEVLYIWAHVFNNACSKTRGIGDPGFEAACIAL